MANEDLTVNTNEARNTRSASLATTSRTYEEAAFKAARRWSHLDSAACRDELFDAKAQMRAAVYQNNIESYIGTVSIPVGLAGPLKIHGEAGTTEYRVPLATTEAALVASYNRGARLLTAAGGCTARVVDQGVSRTPMFAFANLIDAIRFAGFIESQYDKLHQIVAQATGHGKLLSAKSTIEGNNVYLDLRYSTGDACGQNMVTFVSDAICVAILEHSPVTPRYWFLEANFSGDKKANAKAMADVRGKRVVAEITVSRELVREHLHTTPEHMVDYWYAGAIGGVLSGTIGIQGHFANGIAALYLACGQDIACVAESAVGVTRMETTDAGDLYTCVTLPNIMVGTVGGGTGLPSAKACLDLLGLAGPGNSIALAEVCAGIVLAGELSIIGAFCSGDFAKAHRSLSRGEPMEGSK